MNIDKSQIGLRNLDKASPLSQEVVCFLNSLSENRYVNRLIIFGSRAIGDFELYSDLDLAIDAPRIPRFDWLKLREYTTYDLRAFIKISLVHFSTNPKKLRERIVKTGLIIYG